MSLMQWLMPWELSETILFCVILTAAVYISACQRTQISIGSKTCFWLGLLGMYSVTQTELDYYSEHAFFIHQLQSLMLNHVGPFLLVLGCPEGILNVGLPILGKYRVAEIFQSKPVYSLLNNILNPAVLTLLFTGLFIFWLLPGIHFIAMLDLRIYRLMNWSMFISGLLFWRLVLDSNSIYSLGYRIALMLVVVPPQILTGILIFVSHKDAYPIYNLCGRAFPELNFAIDQQVGGLIIWTQASMMSVIGILLVVRKEFYLAGSK